MAVLLEVKHAQDVCLCDNCRRYLYLPEETEATGKSKKEPALQES
jgi:hypothetical protein